MTKRYKGFNLLQANKEIEDLPKNSRTARRLKKKNNKVRRTEHLHQNNCNAFVLH